MKEDKKVTLIRAIKRGETTIKEVEIIEPTVATLKGLALLDVMQLNASAIETILPRVTRPNLTVAEVKQLHIADFSELGVAVVSFFSKEEAEETEQTEEPTETAPVEMTPAKIAVAEQNTAD